VFPIVFTERERLISHCAHVAMHPSGRWVYGSNRGHDSIATFAVEQNTGALTRLAITPTGMPD
jgi:6-phosphogluconolactonase